MEIDVLTLFPEMLEGYLGSSVLGRVQEKGLLKIRRHNIRDYAGGKHRVTDEPPYGGGGGMVLKPEPVFAAVEDLLPEGDHTAQAAVILLTPQGQRFDQPLARDLASRERLILICARYEGIDERVRDQLVTHEISIGDYVLTGGELAAMVVIDAVARLLPGALGDVAATMRDSYSEGILEGAHYTRPELFREWKVPDVLLSGHAARIAQWRRESALRRTFRRRPDLLEKAELSEADRRYLAELEFNEDDAATGADEEVN